MATQIGIHYVLLLVSCRCAFLPELQSVCRLSGVLEGGLAK